MQVSPLQQPFGQEVALQTHAPPTHCCPVVHAGPVPHWQAPPVQPSAPVPQATQAVPATPHAASDGVVQVSPLQQPVGHEAGLQTQAPARHC